MDDIKEILAAVIKLAVKQAREITDDAEALEVQYLYKSWDKQLGKELRIGEYVQYGGALYKVLQTHTVQENWTPVDMTSLFAKVLPKPTGK